MLTIVHKSATDIIITPAPNDELKQHKYSLKLSPIIVKFLFWKTMSINYVPEAKDGISKLAGLVWVNMLPVVDCDLI